MHVKMHWSTLCNTMTMRNRLIECAKLKHIMQEYNRMKDPIKSIKYTQVWYDLDVRVDENHFARLEGST